MPKDRMNEFDKDNTQGKRDAQLKELKDAINAKIEEAKKALAEAEQPLKEKQDELKKLDSEKKDCTVYNTSRKKTPGAKITVASGSGTIAPSDGTYTFSTHSLKFTVKVEYYCIGDPCNATHCSRTYTVSFTK